MLEAELRAVRKELEEERLRGQQRDVLIAALRSKLEEGDAGRRKAASTGRPPRHAGHAGGLALYPWQREALDWWQKRGHRGVVEAVTGSGKTRLAIEATAQQLRRGEPAVIVVPTKELLHQWKRELERWLVGELGRPVSVGHEVPGLQAVAPELLRLFPLRLHRGVEVDAVDGPVSTEKGTGSEHDLSRRRVSKAKDGNVEFWFLPDLRHLRVFRIESGEVGYLEPNLRATKMAQDVAEGFAHPAPVVPRLGVLYLTELNMAWTSSADSILSARSSRLAGSFTGRPTSKGR